MALRMHNARRDQNEPAIVRVFEDMGCAVYRLDQPCDLLLCIPTRTPMADRLALVEVKMPKADLNENQEAFVEAGWPLHVVRSEDDAINLVKRLRAA